MWSKITLSQFIELREVDSLPFDSDIDKIIEIISIVEDIDPEEVGEWSLPKLYETYKSLDWLHSEPPKTFKKELLGYKYKELSAITLAEYIDLSHYFQENYIDNLAKICAVLYRTSSVNSWNHTLIEPYEYDPQEREALFYELPITDIYGIVSEFISFKDNFENTYAPLFEPEFDEGDEDYEETEEDKLEEEKKKFSWEHFVYNLCDGDLTKSNEVLNLQLIFVFNMLAMKNTFGD